MLLACHWHRFIVLDGHTAHYSTFNLDSMASMLYAERLTAHESHNPPKPYKAYVSPQKAGFSFLFQCISLDLSPHCLTKCLSKHLKQSRYWWHDSLYIVSVLHLTTDVQAGCINGRNIGNTRCNPQVAGTGKIMINVRNLSKLYTWHARQRACMSSMSKAIVRFLSLSS